MIGTPALGRYRTSLRRAGALTAALIFLLSQSVNYVAADHAGVPFGSTTCNDPAGKVPYNCVSIGNSFAHYVYFGPSLTSGFISSLNDTMFEDYNPTDLNMIRQSSTSANTDVLAHSLDYDDNGVAGWVSCPTGSPQGFIGVDRWCQNQYLRFNLDPLFAAYTNDDPSRDALACHELGHTLGLQHHGSGCMTVNTPNGASNLVQIDRDHINAQY